ncbi:MAG: PqqD family protein [Planctomycetota bacterium]|jgi:hypothetical protein
MTSIDESRQTGQSFRPRRRDDLHVEELDGEAVLYDSRNGAIHRFNSTTFEVWNACDGTRTSNSIVQRIGKRHSISADEALALVRTVLAQFRENALLHDTCSGDGSAHDHLQLTPRPVPTDDQDYATPTNRPACPVPLSAVSESGGCGISRRELLGGGVTKAVLAAPVISTFFAAGAYASGPSASAAFGTDAGGDCKTVGYSCAANPDCCDGGTRTACEGGECCVQHLQTGCSDDADCCDGPDVCNAGTCE